ncbi:MAG: type II secretion system F family protein, partial [Nostoc sp.]
MPNYVARVRDSQGKSRTETIVAESLVQARTNLRDQGFVVQELKQSQGFQLDVAIKKFQNSLVKVSV